MTDIGRATIVRSRFLFKMIPRTFESRAFPVRRNALWNEASTIYWQTASRRVRDSASQL